MTERPALRRSDLAKLRHDIRTPLGALVGLTGILARLEPVTPKQAQIIETMKVSAADLSDLLDTLFQTLENESPEESEE